ncbi:MAG: hypothetical protein ACE5IF_02445 [Candidatus Bathyarchaeia archaeon]
MLDKRGSFREEKQPKIIVSRFGEVKGREIDHVIKVMRECYGRLMPHEVALVDLYVFERSSLVKAFLAREYNQVGVASAPFDELFFAMHDAWRGTPRIILCLERMKKLPRLVRLGGVRHEVGHSVLHGSLQYYLIPLPPVLLELADRFDLSREYTTNILYLISIAVKDYEVSRLLYDRGYVNDQVAYARHLLRISESDILSWKMSRGNPLATILCLISCLKSASCAATLLDDEKFGKEMRHYLTESLYYIPAKYRSLLLKMIFEGFPSLGTDTLNNINHMAHKCRSIFQTALKGHKGYREAR